MIQYSNRRSNLIYEGIWREIRHFVQNWRKKIGVNLNDPANLSFRIEGEKVVAHLSVPDKACDSENLDLIAMAKPQIIDPQKAWIILASGIEWLGVEAALNSIRATNLITDEEVFWSR